MLDISLMYVIVLSLFILPDNHVFQR